LLLLAAMAGALVAGRPVSPAPATPQQPAAAFFPVGVWYSGGKARAPMLEPVDATSPVRWGRDLDAIRAAGFNMVKTWVDWSTAEPRPGEYHFENLDLLQRLAQDRGLRVVVQVYLDSAPDWVGEKYPDGKYVERSGMVVHSQAAPGYCIDHPGVRREIEKFLRALAAQAVRSPALYGWDAWSEPHVINWAEFPWLNNPEFCYCPSSQARFRDWLREKYGTLAALNAAWYRNFSRWEQVEPPRSSTILSYTDYLDWRAFIPAKLAGDLRTRVAAIRSAGGAHPVTSHAAVPGIFTSPTYGYGSPDDFLMTASGDFFGTSIYPKHAASVRPWPYPMLSAGLDFTRSAGRAFGKGFWIGELQAGQGVTGMRIQEPVVERDTEYWLWKVASYGARKIAIYAWYPMSSGYESGGYGLVELDGTITDRARAGGRVAGLIQKHAAELLAAQPAPAQVAILYNKLSAMVGGAQPSLSRLGNANRDSMMGLHRVFFEANIPVDFVGPEQVAGDKLSAYKILFLPFPVMLPRDVAAGVQRYIENGGAVVAEARLAWNDERGLAADTIPGFGLDRVFGARERVMRPVEKVHIQPAGEWLAPRQAPPGTPAHPLAGEGFEEELAPKPGAEVLARFASGAPAIVSNRFGRGRAVLIGTFAAAAYQRQAAPITPEGAQIANLFRTLAREAGVQSLSEAAGPGSAEVEVRRLLGAGYQFVFVFNHAAVAADASISFPVELGHRARDVTTGADVSFNWQHSMGIFRRKLAPGETWVLRVGKP
jgi:beta-galactosidase